MKHPPYHLRTNKAVDRLLLVDVLRRLDPDGTFTYYSLAGPFLEDLRVIEHYFPNAKLVSLESNKQTFERQKFHQFSSQIALRNQTLSDFLIHDYEPGATDVFWLDYPDLSYSRLDEFQVVLKAVPTGSIVRITLNAEPELDVRELERRLTEEQIARIRTEIQQRFEDEFSKVLPHPFPSATGPRSEYPHTVQRMVRRAASTALDAVGSRSDFLPLHSTRYSDNTQMLSVTGIVHERDRANEVRAQFRGLRFAGLDWQPPSEINIPALSVKECLALERYLPALNNEAAGDVLYPVLGYHISNGERASKEQLNQYAHHYREYPRFIRMSS